VAPLGVAAPERLSFLKDTPTMNEALGGNEYQWIIIRFAVVPKGTPADRKAYLGAAINAAMRDPELVAEVLSVIRELAAEGMTMLIATHEMGFARDIADRVCFLDEGVILEDGPPDKILSAPEQPRTRQFLQSIIEAGRM